MRLVNHEFERKVSEYLFKRVVVPFKPELYSISPQSGTEHIANASDTSHGSVLLLDKGMRVFQGFGSHIRQFAMSFEFDEALLSRPPIKTDQEAVTTFWGIYRWPYKEYNRYKQLEGLEQTADETRTMANALRYIKKARELALSIDGGLGWICGPDSRENSSSKPKVFGGSRYVSDEEPKKQPKALISPGVSFSADMDDEPLISGDQREALLERMLRDSGYEGGLLSRSLRTLAESEGPPHLIQTMFDQARNEMSMDGALRAPGLAGAALNNMRSLLNQRERHLNSRADDPRTLADIESQVRQVGRAAVNTRSNSVMPFDTSAIINSNVIIPLKPNDLTNAQKEMLLETEWAQRAFMQSWAIAIIDNVDTFLEIETLTIARLPSRHLPIIKRDDFWNSLPGLKKLSIAVIPDWREVVKLATSFVQDVKLDPSSAVKIVYELIKDHIAPRKNIKSLHFEWICGGEDAPGMFARNKHILAAPFTQKAIDMVNMVNRPRILSLPHIEHLSMKNCWFSPHILLRFANMHRDTLKSITLDSVSLSAPPTRNAQPGPVNALGNQGPHVLGVHLPNGNPVANHQWAQMQAAAAVVAGQGLPAFHNAINGNQNNNPGMVWAFGQALQNPPAVAVGPIPALSPTAWRNDPRPGSWSSIIDDLTPCETIAMQRFDPDHDLELPPNPKPTKLQKLEFRSCGYLLLPLDFDQSMLLPDGLADRDNVYKRRNDIEQFMMKCSDSSMGMIINHMDRFEEMQLEHAFRMRMGWEGDEGGVERIAIAALDGVIAPGKGRFSGMIQAEATSH